MKEYIKDIVPFFEEATHVTVDSRKVETGALYFGFERGTG